MVRAVLVARILEMIKCREVRSLAGRHAEVQVEFYDSELAEPSGLIKDNEPQGFRSGFAPFWPKTLAYEIFREGFTSRKESVSFGEVICPSKSRPIVHILRR
jgi:hypothetical protein